mgnify:CR=1 FL=1
MQETLRAYGGVPLHNATRALLDEGFGFACACAACASPWRMSSAWYRRRLRHACALLADSKSALTVTSIAEPLVFGSDPIVFGS